MASRSECKLAVVSVMAALVLSGCARYRPHPIDPVTLDQRAVTEEQDGVRVTVAVPSDAEAQHMFGVDLAAAGIQPVWLQIENATDAYYWFAPGSVDPGYFSPREAARRCELWFRSSANARMQADFLDREVGTYLPPHGRLEGVVFAGHERGVKILSVDLIGPTRFLHFFFMTEVPGFQADFAAVDFNKLYDATEIRDVDEEQLRAALEQIPCCATTADGTGTEDPLNFVLLGEGRHALASLLRAGWKVTEVLDRRSAFLLFYSYFFDEEYLHAPISSVYLFGRRQDLALQKTRETARERNHLRIWLTPLRFQGQPVWIGQISRDIGLSYSLRSFLGHVVDPDVDEARDYLVHDLFQTQGMSRFGWVAGVGAAPPSAPRHMTDGTPFYTNGLRAVMEFGPTWTPFDQLQYFDWERAIPKAAGTQAGEEITGTLPALAGG